MVDIITPFSVLAKVATTNNSTRLFALNTTPSPDAATAFMWAISTGVKVTWFFITGHGFFRITWGMFGSIYTKSGNSVRLLGLNTTPSPDAVTDFMWIVRPIVKVTITPKGGRFEQIDPNIITTLKTYGEFL